MGLPLARTLAGLQLALATSLALGAAASCGSRTGLLGEEGTISEVEAGDAPADQLFQPDVPDELPGIDAFFPDVPIINPCPDAAATLIYVISVSNQLYSFDPGARTFAPIGVIRCPDRANPFSMAVDRQGVAYVVFSTGSLYRVSTKTASCTPTAYDAAAHQNFTFGMGFVADVGDGATGETLFVSRNMGGSINSNGELATIDTTTFQLRKVGYFSPSVPGAELTGTGNGQLFAFSPTPNPAQRESFIAQIDPATANVMAKDPLPGIIQGQGWAFGFWGGKFYTFTTPAPGDPTTVVYEFDPVMKTNVMVAMGPPGDTIVGAGVSTCAPRGP